MNARACWQAPSPIALDTNPCRCAKPTGLAGRSQYPGWTARPDNHSQIYLVCPLAQNNFSRLCQSKPESDIRSVVICTVAGKVVACTGSASATKRASCSKAVSRSKHARAHPVKQLKGCTFQSSHLSLKAEQLKKWLHSSGSSVGLGVANSYTAAAAFSTRPSSLRGQSARQSDPSRVGVHLRKPNPSPKPSLVKTRESGNAKGDLMRANLTGVMKWMVL